MTKDYNDPIINFLKAVGLYERYNELVAEAEKLAVESVLTQRAQGNFDIADFWQKQFLPLNYGSRLDIARWVLFHEALSMRLSIRDKFSYFVERRCVHPIRVLYSRLKLRRLIRRHEKILAKARKDKKEFLADGTGALSPYDKAFFKFHKEMESFREYTMPNSPAAWHYAVKGHPVQVTFPFCLEKAENITNNVRDVVVNSRTHPMPLNFLRTPGAFSRRLWLLENAELVSQAK